jgi:hypothetical protein
MKDALLIENSYTGTTSELRGGINDIEIIISLIPGFSITVLKDPSRDKFIEAFIAFLSNSKREKVFFYSGHGSENEVITADFKAIKNTEFKHFIQTYLKNACLFAIFDSCFSGSILDLKYKYSYEEDRLIENEKEETNGNVYLLSSSEKLSYEVKINNKFNGILTLLLQKADLTTWRTLIRSIDELDQVEFPVFSTGKKIDMNTIISHTYPYIDLICE